MKIGVVFPQTETDTLLRMMVERQKAGATHISLNTMGSGSTTPNQHINAISEFAKAALIS